MARGKREIRLNYSHHLVITFAGDDEQCDDRAAGQKKQKQRQRRNSGGRLLCDFKFHSILSLAQFRGSKGTWSGAGNRGRTRMSEGAKEIFGLRNKGWCCGSTAEVPNIPEILFHRHHRS